MKILSTLLFLFLAALTTNEVEEDVRLIFSEPTGMRSSFCIYNDGKFYETRPSGCIGQDFSWGYWNTLNDTVTLKYQTDNVFDYVIEQSKDSLKKYQYVRLIDCYNQPVRFQSVCYDTICANLYNPGILIVEKGKVISYLSPIFDSHIKDENYAFTNADTVTIRWKCNRESIESINGGQLFVNRQPSTTRVILGNKKVNWIDKK